MKLKREHISFMNFSKVFKGILFFGALLLSNSMVAQSITISSTDPDGAEVTAGAANTASFTISRPGGFLSITEVEYSVAAVSTSTALLDHDLVTGTVNLLPSIIGVPSAETIIVNMVDDNLVEESEDIVVNIRIVSGPGTIPLGSDEQILKIVDNDVGVISMDNVGAAYIPTAIEGGANGRFRVQSDLVNGTGSAVTFTFTISGTSGASGSGAGFDHNLSGVNSAKTASTIPNNVRVRNINVIPFDDTVSEVDKTVIITLTGTNNSNFTIDPVNNTSTVTIVDDDCAAGTTAPVLNSDPTSLCDVASVNLNTFVSSSAPPGAAIRWSLNANPTQAQLLSGTAVTAAGAGTYHVLYAAGTGASFCTSPSTPIVIILNDSPEAGADVIAERCNESGFSVATAINLSSTLLGEDPGGDWAWVSGPANVPISGSTVVNFNNDPAGVYTYRYTVTGSGACNDDTADIVITVTGCNPCAAYNTAPTLNNDPTSLCDVASVNLSTYVSNTGPPGSTLRWSLNANPTEAQLLTTGAASTASSDTYYGVFTEGTGAAFCSSPASSALIIDLNDTPNAGADVNAARCNETGFPQPTSINLSDTLMGEDSGGSWAWVSGPANVAINADVVNFNNQPSGQYTYRYTLTGAGACGDDTADIVIAVAGCDPCVAGNTAPVLDPSVPTVSCDVFTASFNDYTNSVAPAGTVLTWSRDSDPTNTNVHLTPEQASSPPTDGGIYYGFFYDALNSCGSPTLQINLTLNVTPTLSNVMGGERCDTGSVMLTASTTNNATINWYASPSGGGIIGTGLNFNTPSISTTTSYYAEATLNGCASERQQAIATIVPQPSAGTPQNNGNASACSVRENGETTPDLDDFIPGADAGTWEYTSGPLADITIPSNNVINFEGTPAGNYVFTFTTTGAQSPCVNETSVITILVNDCDVDTDSDGLFDGPESILGTDPTNADTDGDGVEDGVEVGSDLDNPLDEDEDGIIDALDSNIVDSDLDGIVDQLDPGNTDPCIPTRLNGVCDFDLDDVPDVDDPEPDNPCVPDINHPNCNPDPVDLEVTKEVDNINALIGDEVTFTITLKNLDANAKSRNIIVGELIEDGFDYISHDASIGTYDLQTGEWNISEIEPLSTHTLSITVTILEGGTYDNTAELLDSFPMDDELANNRDTVTLPLELPEGVNLILEKTVSLGFGKEKLKRVTGLVSGIQSEVEVIYFLKVINKSNQDVVSNIRVRDVFTNNENVDFEVINAEVPVETSFDIATGVWLINRSLAVGDEIELSYRVIFRSEGVVLNTAVIESSTPRESIIEDPDSTSSAEVEVTTRNEVEIGILYNQFSPNNDGLNDFLKINRIKKNEAGDDELVDILYNIQIFNRYGNLVFEATSKKEEEVWDGTWKGKDSPDGTYFYTMNLDFGEGPTTQKGWIQLIR